MDRPLPHQSRGIVKLLCLYGARGPLSLERLEERPGGGLAYRMKRPAPDGSTHLMLTPLSLLKKLAALILHHASIIFDSTACSRRMLDCAQRLPPATAWTCQRRRLRHPCGLGPLAWRGLSSSNASSALT